MIYIDNFGWRWGNNLFQIAAVAAHAKKNNDDFVIPPWKYNQYLKNPIKEQTPPYKTTAVYNQGEIFHYKEIPYVKDMAINGYFQSEKFFENAKEEVQKMFEPNYEIVNCLNEKFSDIINDDKICSIHIRRGDYLIHPRFHPVVSLNYIMKAVKYFPKDYKFLIISDDQKWCKESLMGEKFIFIEPQEDIYDFYLMSMIKNNIISNSSFSWFSSWLNKNPDKTIITPKLWFGEGYAHWDTKDLIPESWIKL